MNINKLLQGDGRIVDDLIAIQCQIVVAAEQDGNLIYETDFGGIRIQANAPDSSIPTNVSQANTLLHDIDLALETIDMRAYMLSKGM